MFARFTVLGARGYVGSHLTKHLRNLPDADVLTDEVALPNENLGHVFYCIGVTTDFKQRLHDTMHAHVGVLLNFIKHSQFDSLTYLSTTRVYERGTSGEETATLLSEPLNIADYYKISKIAGEAVCFGSQHPAIRVVRLSNVLGRECPPLTFVPSLITEALRTGKMVLQTALDSAKDYITIEDVVNLLPRIAVEGHQRIYNVASGTQVTHEQIVNVISETLNCSYKVAVDAPRSHFPEASNIRIREEFGYQPRPILDSIRVLCRAYAATAGASVQQPDK